MANDEFEQPVKELADRLLDEICEAARNGEDRIDERTYMPWFAASLESAWPWEGDPGTTLLAWNPGGVSHDLWVRPRDDAKSSLNVRYLGTYWPEPGSSSDSSGDPADPSVTAIDDLVSRIEVSEEPGRPSAEAQPLLAFGVVVDDLFSEVGEVPSGQEHGLTSGQVLHAAMERFKDRIGRPAQMVQDSMPLEAGHLELFSLY